MALHVSSKITPLQSFQVSMEDVARIFARLEGLVKEQGQTELAMLIRPENKSDDEFVKDKNQLLSSAYRVTVTIEGSGSEKLFGDDVSLFTSPNLPVRVSQIYMTNKTAYRGAVNQAPMNSFEFFLDFSKPPLMDANSFVSSPTSNTSKIEVQGARESWVAAISEAVVGVISARSLRRRWLHRGFVYDLGLMILALPLGLYACAKAFKIVDAISQDHVFISSTIYTYIVLCAIWIYRMFFGYTKWAFPLSELSSNRDSVGVHRAIWGALLLGLAVNFLWDLIKVLS